MANAVFMCFAFVAFFIASSTVATWVEDWWRTHWEGR